MIMPTSGKFLSWQATAGPFMGETLKSKGIYGYIWAGFKDELMQKMVEGVKTGIVEYGSGGDGGAES
jgi:hypothetical protein